MAAGPAAALEPLDQRAAHDAIERGQIAEQPAAASAQLGCGRVVHGIRATLLTDPTLLSLFESPVNPLSSRAGKIHEHRKFTETEGVDDQWRSRWLLRWPKVGPLLGDAEAAEIRMAQAQRGNARDTSHFEDDEALTTQRVEWMRDLSRTQRLFADQCSSTTASCSA